MQNNPIESLRRKSCECGKCGCSTKFQQKADIISVKFQTKYMQKMLELQKKNNEIERDKMTKSTRFASLILFFSC